MRVCARSRDPASEVAKRDRAQPFRSTPVVASGRNVRLCRREFALCARTRPVKPGAYRPDRDVECKSDLLVTEVCEGIEEQRIALARTHRRKSARQPSIERRAIYSCVRLVLVGDPPVDSAPAVGVQLTALGSPLAMEQVRRDPVQPRHDAPTCAAALPPREGERERLCRKLVGEITSSAAMQVPVYGTEVPIEDQLERCRLMQRTSQAVRIRRSGVHTLTVPEARLRVSTTGTKVSRGRCSASSRNLPLEMPSSSSNLAPSGSHRSTDLLRSAGSSGT